MDLFFPKDTVRFTSRTGSDRIDSLDLLQTALYSNNSGGSWNSLFGIFGTDYTSVPSRLTSPDTRDNQLKAKYSALPHLGFMYSFGSGGIQYVHVDYQQAFKRNTLLNVRYDRNVSKGLWRNNAFKNNKLQILALHEGRVYQNVIRFQYKNQIRGLNGGFENDSLLAIAGIEFIPVLKNDAADSVKKFNIQTKHFIDFDSDSIRKNGITYQNELKIFNRVFYEDESVYGNYSVYLIDSFSTRDQFQDARLDNSIGYFFANSRFRTEILADLGYWRFQNLGKFRDTTEMDVKWNLAFSSKKLHIDNAFRVNVVGAKNQWSNHLLMRLQQGKITHEAKASIQFYLPDPFQRFYFSNQHQWSTNLSLQGKQEISYKLSSSVKWRPSVSMQYVQQQNTLFLENGSWSNSTSYSSFSMINFQASVDLKWKSFALQPLIGYNLVPSQFDFIPALDARTRLLFNKKFFKAQKFNFLFGVDVRYRSKYSLLYFDPSLAFYQLPSSPNSILFYNPQLKLDLFTGFQIDDFRFYFRFENLDYIWNTRTNLEQIGVPISPSILRFGLTWDFFN